MLENAFKIKLCNCMKQFIDFKDNLSFENDRCSAKLPFKEFCDVQPDKYLRFKRYQKIQLLKKKFKQSQTILD